MSAASTMQAPITGPLPNQLVKVTVDLGPVAPKPSCVPGATCKAVPPRSGSSGRCKQLSKAHRQKSSSPIAGNYAWCSSHHYNCWTPKLAIGVAIIEMCLLILNLGSVLGSSLWKVSSPRKQKRKRYQIQPRTPLTPPPLH